MKVIVRIEEDDGTLVVERTGTAEQPLEFKSPPGYPMPMPRPLTSDGLENGAYMLWGFRYVPSCTLNLQWKKPPR